MSKPNWVQLPLFLSVLLLLLPSSMYLLPSSRELISAMSCFLVFITCSFPLTCTPLLNAAVQDEIPEQREREIGCKKQKNWKHSLHLTYRNILSHKALALISKNHPLSFGHRIHMITAAGGLGLRCRPARHSQRKLQQVFPQEIQPLQYCWSSCWGQFREFSVCAAVHIGIKAVRKA